MPEDNAATRRRRSGRDHLLYRLAPQARPHYILAGLFAAGAASAGLGPAITTPGTAGLAVAATGAAVTGAACIARRRRAGVTGRQVAGGLAAAGWLGWVTAAGLSWPATAVLAAGGYATSLRWWRRRRIADPPPQTGPPEVDELAPPRLWASNIAASDRPLPDSHLAGEQRTATGVRYQLHLVPGKQTLGTALTKLPHLRTGLRLTRGQDLVVEANPETDESVVSLTVVRRSPVLNRPTPWPGPDDIYDPHTGRVALGPYVDGDGYAEWRLAAGRRLFGGFLVGSTGSGKSSTIEALTQGAAAGAGCVIWFADPQGGASSPWLADQADWTARDVPAIREMLEAAMRVRQMRQNDNAYCGRAGWQPGEAFPGLLLIIDECHEALADPRVQELTTTLARSGGKVGVAVVLASHILNLESFGAKVQGQRALRGSVITGNLVLLRTSDGTGGTVSTGGVDPASFPAIPGYAYLVDAGDGSRRSAPFRAFHMTEQARDEAAAQVTWQKLDQLSAAAAGQPYQQRHQRALAAREALMAEITALTNGEQPTGLLTAASSPVPERPALPGAAPPVPRFPIWRKREPEQSASPPGGTTAVESVAAALADGATRPAELQRVTGYGETAVRLALDELRESGQVHRAGYGRYELTAEPAAATQ